MGPWSRIQLLTQETRVRSLVQEDPTCHRGTKPVYHSYRACSLESGLATLHTLQPVCSATKESTTMRSPHTTTGE